MSLIFRKGIKECAVLLSEEKGKEHTVFVYGKTLNHSDIAKSAGVSSEGPIVLDKNFPANYPFYIRNQNEYEMEDIHYRLDTVHGAADFDSPGAAIQAAARLAKKLDLAAKLEKARPGTENDTKVPLLIYDAGQGHFALWLSHYLKAAGHENNHWVLSGRNIIALASARAALCNNTVIIPTADIFLDRERLSSSKKDFRLIAFFPETVSETDRREANWQGLSELAEAGSIIIIGMSSSEAERFDKKKPTLFSRLGDIKRKGFRALAYQKQG